MITLEIWASAFLGMSIGILVYVFFKPKKNLLQEQLKALETSNFNFQTRTNDMDFVSRVVKPLLSGITHRISRNLNRMSISDVRKRLILAGNPFSLTVEQFVALKIMTAILLGGLLMVVTTGVGGFGVVSLLWGILGVVGGWLVPDFWLTSLRKARQKRIISELPSILDILVVTTEAGLTFDSALRRIHENTDGELSKEIGKVIEDLQLNRPRSEALRDWADRCGVDDLSIFITSIIQAETTGTSVSNVLRAQAKRAREKVRQRLQEKGGKIAVALIFPTVMFIVPALFIIVLGGAILNMSGRIF